MHMQFLQFVNDKYLIFIVFIEYIFGTSSEINFLFKSLIANLEIHCQGNFLML